MCSEFQDPEVKQTEEILKSTYLLLKHSKISSKDFHMERGEIETILTHFLKIQMIKYHQKRRLSEKVNAIRIPCLMCSCVCVCVCV